MDSFLLNLMFVVIGIVIVGLGEITTLIFFLLSWRDLHKKKTDFKIPYILPVITVVLSIGVSWLVFQMDTYFLSESKLPFDQRVISALRILGLLNITTPLFPILAWMKQRKIKALRKG